MRLFVFAVSVLLISSPSADVVNKAAMLSSDAFDGAALVPSAGAIGRTALIPSADMPVAEMAAPALKNFSGQIPDTSRAEAAYTSFTALFEERPDGLPENVEVLGVRIRDGVLTVNLSEDFLRYGGNENESVFIGVLKKTAREIPGVTHLTLLIEGQLKSLTEGRLVDKIPV